MAERGGASGERPELAAWRAFCRRIESLGEEVLREPYPCAPEDGPEGIAHLADQVACWLGWSIGHLDATAPFFHRSNDLFTQWGGPNQDNAYHHARIDPRRRYRVSGRMNACEDFALTLRAGFMHMEVWGTKLAITASERGIGPGDAFELLFGGDGSEPGWIAIPDDVTTLSLREYYLDWRPAEPAVFAIECLDDVPAPPRLDGAAVAGRLEHALAQVDRSMTQWNAYLREHRAKGRDNTFALPQKLSKGLPAARYAFCFFDLDPGEALVVETDVPDARYWSLQLATMGWFEPVDPVHRITSINQRQAHVDGDGRVRVVVAHADPGAPNWLDTGGHRDGLLTFRWFWPRSDPSPTTRVARLDEVDALLPQGSPRVGPDERRRDVARRKAHLAWRFRT
ncbi:MAG: DUF1214 domain-containing protein [Myxococcota bacterium]